jgi:uncharacterized protein YdeI (YjbR/CyaY-like superfamily)
MAGGNLRQVEVRSREELRNWLERNHIQPDAVWLVTHKKHRTEYHLPYSEAVDELICFGWVDSLPRKLDDDRSMLMIAPRKPKSNWSKINKDKADRLAAEGRMRPAGLAAVEKAKAGGQWDALNAVEALDMPDDLSLALAGNRHAAGHFQAFPKSAKRGILEWIGAAKTAETRAKRVEETARLAKDNIRANQWRQPKPA